MRITVYCDGSCEPTNPGGYGCSAFVAFEGNFSGAAGRFRPRPLVEKYTCIGHGDGMTNNVSEYHAVIGALRWLLAEHRDAEIVVRTDSQLVVRQVNGEWACNKEHLRGMRDEARELIEQFECLELEWVRREENDVADALTRRAYAEATGRKVGERTKEELMSRRPPTEKQLNYLYNLGCRIVPTNMAQASQLIDEYLKKRERKYGNV